MKIDGKAKDPYDLIDNHVGYSMTARLTGLLRFEEQGRRLLHLGFFDNLQVQYRR